MEYFIGAIVLYILYRWISGNSRSNTIKDPKTRNTQSQISEHRASTYASSSANTSSISSYDSADDEFATFTIQTSYGYESEKSSNKQKGRWIGDSEQLTINGRKLDRGLFYFGGVMKSLSGYEVEPSLVDETRSVSKPPLDRSTEIHTDESLGYWPSYATLSEGCKGAYLDWLASERSNPNIPIGYVFIYFYGFERRVIESNTTSDVSDSEFIAIFNEVIRLNKVFSANRSFNRYSSHLLELMTLLRPLLLASKVDEIPETTNAFSFKIKLAETVVKEQSVGAELALAWLKNTIEYSLKMPARRCEEEFKQLFEIRFKQKFGEGIPVKPNKTKLRLSYNPASNGIHGVDLAMEELPDPSILKGPINKLIPIAESCTEELASYSRYLGKVETSKNDIAALMLLPKELVNESNSPIIREFEKWAEQVIEKQGGLTTVKEFWSHTGMPFPKAINKKENELLTNLANKANIGIAPDQRFHQAKVTVDGNIVLFTPAHGEFFEPSIAFNQVSLAMRLGAMVATIDGYVDQEEKFALQRLVDQDEKLSPSEKNSLKAYLIWRLNSPVNTAGLKARIEKLRTNEVEFLKKFMISIALVDGKVDSSEIKQIEKLYTSLGLDRSLVTSDIHNLTSSNSRTFTSSESTDTSANTFKLDEGILAMHESETSDAKTMLENIFAVDDEPEIEIVSLVQTESDGLDDAHKELYDTLLSKETWSRNEVHEFCSKLSLMVDGAIETINDWAYEKVDAPVLDDDGDIYVDLEIVEELKG